jgi:hypothetical protein
LGKHLLNVLLYIGGIQIIRKQKYNRPIVFAANNSTQCYEPWKPVPLGTMPAMECNVVLVCWLLRMWYKILKYSQERFFMDKDHSCKIDQTYQPIQQKYLN